MKLGAQTMFHEPPIKPGNPLPTAPLTMRGLQLFPEDLCLRSWVGGSSRAHGPTPSPETGTRLRNYLKRAS